MQPEMQDYPATFAFDPPERIDNWRPLVQWLLAIPHAIILYGLRIAAGVMAILSWFAILFTGKMPESFANFLCMYIRYEQRLWSYVAFLRSEYPPFGFSTTAPDPGDDPRLKIGFTPELENRNRLTVGFRLILIIPVAIVAALLVIGAFFVGIVAFFVVLFTGKWPTGMRDFVLKVFRFSLRVSAYQFLLTDRYPPFALS